LNCAKQKCVTSDKKERKLESI
jgi:hypothetical protein